MIILAFVGPAEESYLCQLFWWAHVLHVCEVVRGELVVEVLCCARHKNCNVVLCCMLNDHTLSLLGGVVVQSSMST